jgi:hypothetical protein
MSSITQMQSYFQTLLLMGETLQETGMEKFVWQMWKQQWEKAMQEDETSQNFIGGKACRRVHTDTEAS